jgi:hypothetical protein
MANAREQSYVETTGAPDRMKLGTLMLLLLLRTFDEGQKAHVAIQTKEWGLREPNHRPYARRVRPGFLYASP